MAGLALGMPVVTTTGHLTEDEWRWSGAAVLVPVGRADALASQVQRLLSAPDERQALGTRARQWYRANFSIEHTLDVLGVQRSSGKVG